MLWIWLTCKGDSIYEFSCLVYRALRRPVQSTLVFKYVKGRPDKPGKCEGAPSEAKRICERDVYYRQLQETYVGRKYRLTSYKSGDQMFESVPYEGSGLKFLVLAPGWVIMSLESHFLDEIKIRSTGDPQHRSSSEMTRKNDDSSFTHNYKNDCSGNVRKPSRQTFFTRFNTFMKTAVSGLS